MSVVILPGLQSTLLVNVVMHFARGWWPFANLRDRFRAAVRSTKEIIARKSLLCHYSQCLSRSIRSSLTPSMLRING